MRWWLLAAAFCLSEAGYLAILWLNSVNGVRPVVTFLAVMLGLFACYATAFLAVRGARYWERPLLLLVASGAVLFRLTLLPAGLPHGQARSGLASGFWADLRGEAVTYERFLIFDDDIWRYLWDGHVWAQGVNPYRYAPSDDALNRLGNTPVWREIRDNINHPTTPTIYPPLAQAVFRFSYRLAPGSVAVMKAVLTGFDLLAAFFVALSLRELGRPPAYALLYAWNPLVVKAFAGSGHVDAIVAAALAGCAYFFIRQRRALAAFSFSLAVLAKIAPLILFPLVLRRAGLRNGAVAGAAVLAAYVPFAHAGAQMFAGLLKFAHEWQFNAGPFAVMRFVAGWFTASPAAARVISGLAIVGLVVWASWRDDGLAKTFPDRAAALLGFSLILSPVVMPWYITGVLPLAAVGRQWQWFTLSALVCCAFFVMIDGVERIGALSIEYGAFALVLGLRARETHQNSLMKAALGG